MNAKASTPTNVRFGGGKSVLDSVSNTTRRRIHELSMKNSAPKRDAKTVDKENYKPKISKLLSRFEGLINFELFCTIYIDSLKNHTVF